MNVCEVYVYARIMFYSFKHTMPTCTGLLTEDPSLYRPDAFMQTPILPVRETAARLQRVLMARGDLDCVVALTHQVD